MTKLALLTLWETLLSELKQIIGLKILLVQFEFVSFEETDEVLSADLRLILLFIPILGIKFDSFLYLQPSALSKSSFFRRFIHFLLDSGLMIVICLGALSGFKHLCKLGKLTGSIFVIRLARFRFSSYFPVGEIGGFTERFRF